MENLAEFKSKFLTDTDDSGRFIITSQRTGRIYFVEPIGYTKTAFGDVNPATKKVEGNYGEKYRGSIDEAQSLITIENGFENIHEIGPGSSPQSKISELDSKYPDKP